MFGHIIQPLTTESELLSVIYHFIYFFHMPAIILISGFFAKGSRHPKYLFSLIRKLIIPYIIFQAIYTVYYYLINDSSWKTSLFEPHWSLWFLLSLFCWHIMLIGFKKLSPVVGIFVAILLGLAVGYVDQIGHDYSLSRTFVFFPFFLTGYWLTKEQLFRVKSRRYRLISLVIILMAIGLIAFIPPFPSGWLYGSLSYAELGQPLIGGMIRFLVYMIAFLLVFSIYAWVPKQEALFTRFGQQTIYVYLLHGLFVQFFRENNTIQIGSIQEFFLVMLLTLAIVLLLSSKPIFISFQPIIETKTTGLKKIVNKASS